MTAPPRAREGSQFDNHNRIYVGFGDDGALNRSVKRYTAGNAFDALVGWVREGKRPAAGEQK